ncbi:mandelate racemase [Devosia geojensis]|uniref:Dipeptide epimerase n=1 Tax=Devosia geojensis TaxID=443610 RepID=A0A0F5FWQ9_9HYPH|nr:N-acetyl-D-Glu racemase DgcA [Devosia geojensis]KKB13289.1 mandelate racemase [Devosia geojensis]
MTQLAAAIERFPIAGTFTISRGSKHEAVVVHVTLTRDGVTGHGECVPYARYGETPKGVLTAILSLAPAIAAGLDRQALQSALPPGAARNALDCAFWDLDAKLASASVAALAGLEVPPLVTTAYTISLGTPEAVAEAASKAAAYPLLKLKLGGAGDRERLAAVRAAVPQARLIVDANEAWAAEDLAANLSACRDLGIELVEQPLPAGADAPLGTLPHPVPIYADESIHGLASLDALAGRYEAINIKLDKTGGLTEAIGLARRARERDMKLMVGCMVGTSLSMAPALLLSGLADWVDLDGPLLLQEDRPEGLRYAGGRIDTSIAVWGR